MKRILNKSGTSLSATLASQRLQVAFALRQPMQRSASPSQHRSFHHRSEAAGEKPIQFDNGQAVEGWSQEAGGRGLFSSLFSPGMPSNFLPPSALEAEVNLPSLSELQGQLPSAAEAEKMIADEECVAAADEDDE